MLQMEIEHLFHRVKRLYFPRWDRENKWHIVKNSRFSWDAGCDSDTKTIYIREYATISLVAHEISHALFPNHGKQWQARLLKVAEQSRSSGRRKLAYNIIDDVHSYQLEGIRITVALVRKDIIDAMQQKPGTTFKEVINLVAESWFIGPKELLSRYKNLRLTYDQAKQQFDTSLKV